MCPAIVREGSSRGCCISVYTIIIYLQCTSRRGERGESLDECLSLEAETNNFFVSLGCWVTEKGHTYIKVFKYKQIFDFWDPFRYTYYSGPTGEFTGPSIGHNYLRKNGTNLPIDALNRSPRDLSIGL